GSVFRDLDTYPKLVGGITPECAAAGHAFYSAHLAAEVRVLSSVEAAELTKIAEALYRDVNISLANEIARFADARDIDVPELITALRERGAEVRVNDPVFGREGVEDHGYTWGEPGDGWAEALVLQAAHSAYRDLGPHDVPSVVAVLDGRNTMDPRPWRAAGVA